MTDPLNLNDVLRDICRLQAECFRAEAKAGLEFRTRRHAANLQKFTESIAAPVEHEVVK